MNAHVREFGMLERSRFNHRGQNNQHRPHHQARNEFRHSLFLDKQYREQNCNSNRNNDYEQNYNYNQDNDYNEDYNYNQNEDYDNNDYGDRPPRPEREGHKKSFLEKALPYAAVGLASYGIGKAKGNNLGEKTGNFLGGIFGGLFGKKAE
jgi:hypothetical protein